MQALRDALKDLSKGQNASLLLARYLTRTKKENEEKEEAQNAPLREVAPRLRR